MCLVTCHTVSALKAFVTKTDSLCVDVSTLGNKALSDSESLLSDSKFNGTFKP